MVECLKVVNDETIGGKLVEDLLQICVTNEFKILKVFFS